MEIAQKNLLDIIKEEVSKVIEEQDTNKQTRPINQAQAQVRAKQVYKIVTGKDAGKDKVEFAWRVGGQPGEPQILLINDNPIPSQYVPYISGETNKLPQSQNQQKPATNTVSNPNPTDAVLQGVTQRFKNAKPQAIKKIIELQAMLVQLGVAPAKLKSGKPFIDGIFGNATIAAIKKLYR